MDGYLERIGILPEKWIVVRLKDVAEPYTGNSIKDEIKEKYTDENDAIPYVATKDIDADNQRIDYGNGLYIKKADRSFKRADKGSTLLCIEGGSAGKKIAFTDRDVCFVNKLCCFHSRTENNKYIYYYLMSPAFTEAFNSYIAGLIGGVSTVSLKNFYICLPERKEQDLITDFLDEKCAEIDKLLEDIKKQIDILEEYKKSVITRAVTKDMNPQAFLNGLDKNGGLSLPDDWSICRIKDCCVLVRGGSPRPIDEYLADDDEPGYNWVRIGDTQKGYKYIDRTHLRIKKAGLAKTRLVTKGTLLLTNSMSFGQPYIMNINGCIHDGWLAFYNFKDLNKEFLYYYLLSEPCGYQFIMSVAGAVVVNLNTDKVGAIKMLLPPLDIQGKIVDYLDERCSEIDASIEAKNEQLENLVDYKKSIIYEYVTGKKRVKGVN